MSLLDSLITDLGIISKINSGYTLTCRNDKLITIPHDKKEGLQRWLNGESRESTKDVIETIIEHAIEYSSLMMESVYIHPPNLEDQVYNDLFIDRMNNLTKLCNNLNSAKDGINQLSTTYKDDETYIQQLITLKNKIQNHVDKLVSKLRLLKQMTHPQNKKTNIEN